MFSFTVFGRAQFDFNISLLDYLSGLDIRNRLNYLIPQLLSPIIIQVYSQVKKTAIFDNHLIQNTFQICRTNIKVIA